ncbi:MULTISPECIES: pentapeptide repeat-containing protein [Streptomyces]|uniref:Pentapeptide repeat-containing protein n=1 Tax=Streptomyces sudanensis TaxID=436397 RepID=A0ABY4T9H3_9ACTN|nr:MULTISPECIES: pentapeptide repeat-containing protein [Streptomyces]URN15576.1 pentapeptide repeat-containing protein [Streptomyces sudanensis]
MARRVLGRVTVATPDLDEPGPYLSVARTLDGLVLDDVLFENRRLDYASFEKVRVAVPVAFVGCALTEAVFTGRDLSGAVFSDCRLRLTAFGGGRYRDTDLGGSDLSQVRGVANPAGVRIGPGGRADLAQALVDELGITVGDT